MAEPSSEIIRAFAQVFGDAGVVQQIAATIKNVGEAFSRILSNPDFFEKFNRLAEEMKHLPERQRDLVWKGTL